MYDVLQAIGDVNDEETKRLSDLETLSGYILRKSAGFQSAKICGKKKSCRSFKFTMKES